MTTPVRSAGPWKAGCGETRTSGLEGGMGEPMAERPQGTLSLPYRAR
jgi:hypothetical protein